MIPAWRSRPASGFTLLEILVVLGIVGIVFLGAAVLTVERHPEREAARRFSALLALARDQALMSGETLGVELWRDGYRFHRLDGDWSWRPVGRGPLRERTLAPGLRLELLLDGVPAELDARPGGAPQLHLLSTGESTAFELRVAGARGEAVVRRDLLGRPGAAPR